MENLDALTKDIENISLNKDDSFLYKNLECRDFVVIETRADHGQVVVATKDIAVGARIIREDPILVYEDSNIEEMVSKFMALDWKSRDAILNMNHPPVLSPDMFPQGFLIACELSLDPALIEKLIAIDECNSHEYHGSEREIYFHVQSALFLFLSKLAHACNPNTVLVMTRDGRMECRVVRPIKAGDLITYSLDGFLAFPNPRKHEILQGLGRICHCPQCTGSDYSRPIYCQKCRGGVLVCTKSRGGCLSWSCSGCDGAQNVERRIEALETKAEESLVRLEVLQDADTSMCPVSKVKDTINMNGRKLHPQHYTTLGCMQIFIKICVSDAIAMEIMPIVGIHPLIRALVQRERESPTELRCQAAKMGVSLVEKLECIAAGCIHTNFLRLNENAPAPTASKYALLVGKMMMRCPSSTWPTNGSHVVHRYIPILKAIYGEEDEDIVAIELNIPAPPNQDTQAAVRASSSFPVAAEKKAKQRRKRTNKKKKGRKRY